MTAHKHAALMLQYAQDAAQTDEPWRLWQVKPGEHHDPSASGWYDIDENPEWAAHTEYRRKPRTIRIGEFDVPEPLRVAPASGAIYFVPAIAGSRPNLDRELMWSGFDHDLSNLERGIIHLTKEAAEQHARALLAFTK